MTVVEKGVLKGFLMSRSPVRGFEHSNGHGRRQAGLKWCRGNPTSSSSPRKGAGGQLREMLIAEAKRQNKPYGLYFSQVSSGYTHGAAGDPGLQSDSAGGLPRLSGRPQGRVGARRRYRRNAAGELRQDRGYRRPAGSLQRVLRRGIRQRSGGCRVAIDSDLGDRDTEASEVPDRPPLLPAPDLGGAQ